MNGNILADLLLFAGILLKNKDSLLEGIAINLGV